MWLAMMFIWLPPTKSSQLLCAQEAFKKPFQEQVLELKPVNTSLNNIVCSLTFIYDHGYCTSENASSVNNIFADFHPLPTHLQNALQKALNTNYNDAYHFYNKTFDPASWTYTHKVLACLLKEFGAHSALEDNTKNDEKIPKRAIWQQNEKIVQKITESDHQKKYHISKRAANNSESGYNVSQAVKPRILYDPQPPENREVLFWIIVAGAIAPILWLSIAYCVLISMENTRLMEELEERLEGVEHAKAPAEQEKPEKQIGGEKPKGEAAEAAESAEGPVGGKKQPEPAVSPAVAAEDDFFSLPKDSGTPEASPGQAVTPLGPNMAKAKPVRKTGKAVKTPPPKKTAKKPRSSKPKTKGRTAISKTPKKSAKPKKSPRPSAKRRKK